MKLRQGRWIPIIGILAAVPAFALLYWILKFGVNVPYWDDWAIAPLFRRAVDGTLSFRDLMAQHNESRKFFPRLIFLALGFSTHWDLRADMLFIFLLACVFSALILRLSFRTVRGTPLQIGLAWLVANLIVFGPIQNENWLWGIQIVVFIPLVCITGCLLVAYSRLSPGRKVAGCMCLATISTFSFANGILCWIVAFPLLFFSTSRREWWEKRWPIIGWLMALLLCLAFYFHGYRGDETKSSAYEFAVTHKIVALAFGAAFLGSPLGIDKAGMSACIGLGLLAAFAAIVAYALFVANSRMFWYRIGGWLCLGFFAVFSSAMAAMGRSCWGIELAVCSRYVTHAACLLLAVIYGGIIVFNDLRDRERPAARSRLLLYPVGFLATLVLGLHLLTSLRGLQEMRETMLDRLTAKAAVLTVNCVAEEELLEKKVFPSAAVVKSEANDLDRMGLIQPPLFHDRTIGRTTLAVSGPNPEAGRFEVLNAAGSETRCLASGWAVSLGDRRPADAVILTYAVGSGADIMFALADTRLERKDIAQRFGRPGYNPAGWQKAFPASRLPKGILTVKAWTLDTRTGCLKALAGAHTFDNS